MLCLRHKERIAGLFFGDAMPNLDNLIRHTPILISIVGGESYANEQTSHGVYKTSNAFAHAQQNGIGGVLPRTSESAEKRMCRFQGTLTLRYRRAQDANISGGLRVVSG
ncbi:hypothetical protein TNCV_306921 [Trichonephila clavipes]|nr:hypothetical protein TNCV_306921 [Trichonephila clavipes]